MEKTKANLVPMWVNLSRAYEIAKLGNLTIQIVYNQDYPQGASDYLQLKEFYKDVQFVASGDLIVEIFKPDYYSSGKRQYETLSDLDSRVEKAKENILPTEHGSTSSDALLKTATSRLNFSLSDVELVNKIAGVIAQLDKSKSINAEHTAEAIHYRAFLKSEQGVIAENASLYFGNYITIANTKDIQREDIKLAIEHLQSLL